MKAGFAWWFRKYAPKDTELEALESEARAAKRGLWADPKADASLGISKTSKATALTTSLMDERSKRKTEEIK